MYKKNAGENISVSFSGEKQKHNDEMKVKEMKKRKHKLKI
jgi:hypothetical protein